jgi:hypothetical protein
MVGSCVDKGWASPPSRCSWVGGTNLNPDLEEAAVEVALHKTEHRGDHDAYASHLSKPHERWGSHFCGSLKRARKGGPAPTGVTWRQRGGSRFELPTFGFLTNRQCFVLSFLALGLGSSVRFGCVWASCALVVLIGPHPSNSRLLEIVTRNHSVDPTDFRKSFCGVVLNT